MCHFGTSIWPGTGFNKLAWRALGDHTFVIAYKAANHEPSEYTDSYGVRVTSATIALIAVSGANQGQPIDNNFETFNPNYGSPVVGGTSGITTTSPNCLLVLMAGVAWDDVGGSNTFTPPNNYATLTAFGDHGDTLDWDRTSMMVATGAQAIPGATGSVQWSATSSTRKGVPWTMLLAIAPPK